MDLVLQPNLIHLRSKLNAFKLSFLLTIFFLHFLLGSWVELTLINISNDVFLFPAFSFICGPSIIPGCVFIIYSQISTDKYIDLYVYVCDFLPFSCSLILYYVCSLLSSFFPAIFRLFAKNFV